MRVVKIKNLNKSHLEKTFIVKGRIRYLKVDNNKKSSGKHLNSILFDDSSEIEVVAFKDCDEIFKKLNTDNVVQIENAMLKEVNKDYKKTKHKYKIILISNSIITTINNNEVNNNDFPIHKYTSAAVLKTLETGMIIDVFGVCIQLNSEKTNTQSQTYRKGVIRVELTEFEVRFYGEKAEKLYDVGSVLTLSCVTYINIKGSEFLSVGHLSNVKCTLQQLFNVPVLESLAIESPDQIPSTSYSTPSIKSLAIESPVQIPSTSYSTPSIKRTTQDINVEESPSKILKIADPEESFSDERFFNTVQNLLKEVDDKNINVIKLRILEFISEILRKNKT
ncbi:uncharacterized protein LOC112595926 isoform X2 [Melanaphis sacchari]|nr:uncharacterized protein LOC112595926 isoform X2 [Melanaphis sacchari]